MPHKRTSLKGTRNYRVFDERSHRSQVTKATDESIFRSHQNGFQTPPALLTLTKFFDWSQLNGPPDEAIISSGRSQVTLGDTVTN